MGMDKATSVFLERGILGALVVILLGVVAFLFLRLERANDRLIAIIEQSAPVMAELRDLLRYFARRGRDRDSGARR